jgi:hypothetical protein
MNQAAQATAHETKIRRWAAFTPPQRGAIRAVLWPIFTPALIPS